MTRKHVTQLMGLVALGVVLGILAGCGGSFKFATATLPGISVPAGRSGKTEVTLTRERFEGEISFSLTGAPTGVTATFDPTKTDKKGTKTTLTLAVAATVAPQKYPLKVVATSGKLKKDIAVELTVLVAPDFSMAPAPAALTVRQGASGPVTVNLTRNATFTGAVALTLEGAPAGVTGTFSPASATGATSTLTLSVAATVPAGPYTLTIRGRGDGIDKTARVTLTVEALPGFSMSATPTAIEVKRGQAVTVTINIRRVGGLADPIQLEVEGVPTGVTTTFEPNPATADTATLRITCGTTAAAGTYPFRVRGTAGTISQTTTVNLTIAP